MAKYKTTSKHRGLNGSMVVTNQIVQSYTSTSKGPGSLLANSSVLDFEVSFNGPPSYHIVCRPYGTGYRGRANNGSPVLGEETWTAAATTIRSKTKSTGSAARNKTKAVKAAPKSKTTRAQAAVKSKSVKVAKKE